VPTLYSSGEAPDGSPYFTMELICGDTLRKVMDGSTLDPVQALGLAIELGKILMWVHAKGMVHRDVKPGNVIVEPGGRVRLIDFGACLPLREFYRRESIVDITAPEARWRTGDHEAIGTPGYTDPAALRDKNTTFRSDIYSVCTILYEALTGRARVDKESGAARAITTDEFPPQLDRLAAELRRGTEREPSRRHRSMAELVQTLEVVRGEILRARMPVRPPRGRAAGLVLASAGLALVTAVALHRSMSSSAERTASGEEADGSRELAAPAGAPGHERSSALSVAVAPARVSAPLVLAATDVPAASETDDGDGWVAPAPAEERAGATRPAATASTMGSTPASRAPASTIPRKLRTALRACRSDGARTVVLVIRDGHASVDTIDHIMPDDRKPGHRCVLAALARLEFPGVSDSLFRTVEL
jgi:serine/threonine-protein kinase